MPYYDKGNHNQTDKFLISIDAMQTIMDKYASDAPVKIVGDMNVKLPARDSLTSTWYRQSGFNIRSSIKLLPEKPVQTQAILVPRTVKIERPEKVLVAPLGAERSPQTWNTI